MPRCSLLLASTLQAARHGGPWAIRKAQLICILPANSLSDKKMWPGLPKSFLCFVYTTMSFHFRKKHSWAKFSTTFLWRSTGNKQFRFNVPNAGPNNLKHYWLIEGFVKKGFSIPLLISQWDWPSGSLDSGVTSDLELGNMDGSGSMDLSQNIIHLLWRNPDV